MYFANQDHEDAKADFYAAERGYGLAQSQADMDRDYAQMGSSQKSMKSAKSKFQMYAGIVGSVYLVQLADAWKWGGGKRQIVKMSGLSGELSPYLAFEPDGAQVGVAIEFGRVK